MYGNDLGNAVKTIMYALDPDAIVIGGQISEAYEFFTESLHKTVASFIHAGTVKNIRIFKSTEPYISIYGAAALCFE